MLPDFILVVMALINIGIMIFSYWWLSSQADDPREAVPFVAVESVLIMVVGNLVTESAKRIVNANRLKKEFTDIVSHQMRSPLSAIKWYMEMLLRSGQDNLTQKQHEYVEVIIEANRKMLSLINDLLNMTNIEKGKEQFVFEKINIIELIEETIKNYRIFSNQRSITVTFNKGRNKKIWIMSDQIKLKIVVENLLNNALRYTPKNGLVQVNLVKLNGYVTFEIKDNGMGIGEKEKPHVFEKFFRSKQARNVETQGTGLGLYICRTLLRKMDGDIWFKSRIGRGTSFFFKIPVAA